MIRTVLHSLSMAFCLLLCAATTASAQQQPVAPAPAQPSVAPAAAPLVSDPDYVLGEGDIIEVMVVGNPEFNTRARVSNDGSTVLPLIGPIKAGGESPSVLSERIATALKKGNFYTNPIVRVELVGIKSRYVTVLGNVGTTRLLPLDRNYRLSEIFALVGGKSAGGADHILVTSNNGESKRYDMAALATGGPAEDPFVRPGDKIYVPPAETDVFYIQGEVRTPGAFPIQTDMTVRFALARAGGVTENGNDKKVSLTRDGKTTKGVDLDTKLQPRDVIAVGARLF